MRAASEPEDAPEEVWAQRAASRLQQIEIGKARLEYQRYARAVPKWHRTAEHLQTPDPYARISKRAFDRQLSDWRRRLHDFDRGADDASPSCGGTPQGTSSCGGTPARSVGRGAYMDCFVTKSSMNVSPAKASTRAETDESSPQHGILCPSPTTVSRFSSAPAALPGSTYLRSRSLRLADLVQPPTPSLSAVPLSSRSSLGASGSSSRMTLLRGSASSLSGPALGMQTGLMPVSQTTSGVQPGSMAVPQCSMLLHHGSIAAPPGSMLVQQGSIAAPPGSMIAQQGSIAAPPGSMLVQGSIAAPPGCMLVQQGSCAATPGIMLVQQGSIVAPPGSMIAQQGSIAAPLGSTLVQQGCIAAPQGFSAQQGQCPQLGQQLQGQGHQQSQFFHVVRPAHSVAGYVSIAVPQTLSSSSMLSVPSTGPQWPGSYPIAVAATSSQQVQQVHPMTVLVPVGLNTYILTPATAIQAG